MTSPGPWAGKSDAAVLGCAADHLQKSAALPHGSLASKRELSLFWAAMAEIERRQAAARYRAALRLRPVSVTWRDL